MAIEIPSLLRDTPFSVLVGTAGTGKTTLMRQWAEEDPGILLCATTGIAAVNLGTTTINSWLWYFDTADLEQKYKMGTIQAALRKIRSSRYRRIVVDECSMMDGRQLDFLCYALDEVNLGYDDPSDGLALTLVGDFAQLPPVNAPYVFERPAWERFKDQVTVLTKFWRQTDPGFIGALQALRRGDREASIAYFGPSIAAQEDRTFRGTTLVAKNEEVERINRIRLLELKGTSEYFPSLRTGKPRPEWRHIPERLEVKPGALCMVLANGYEGDPGDRELVHANGDLAEYLEKINDRQARVRLFRGDTEVVVDQVRRDHTQVTGATGDRKPRTETVGSITYMPLRLAFASTVHKCQGLTLDAVQVLYHNQFWANEGMLYVACSRARSPQGLRLVGTPRQFAARVTPNQKVQQWL
jgi:hypothetical protein